MAPRAHLSSQPNVALCTQGTKPNKSHPRSLPPLRCCRAAAARLRRHWSGQRRRCARCASLSTPPWRRPTMSSCRRQQGQQGQREGRPALGEALPRAGRCPRAAAAGATGAGRIESTGRREHPHGCSTTVGCCLALLRAMHACCLLDARRGAQLPPGAISVGGGARLALAARNCLDKDSSGPGHRAQLGKHGQCGSTITTTRQAAA